MQAISQATPGVACEIPRLRYAQHFASAGLRSARNDTCSFKLSLCLAIIKNRCRLLIAPDSGVLTMVYYLDVAFPLDVISLWSDPRQGILRQGCSSPNPLLRHIPLYGARADIRNLSVAAVESAVRAALGSAVRQPASDCR